MSLKLQKIMSFVMMLSAVTTVFLGVFFTFVPQVQAATFTMRTGYYMGDGSDDRAITGIGFEPDLVMIKDDNTAGGSGMVIKTSSMSGEIAHALSETDTGLDTNHIQSLDSDGFTIGDDADVNTANTIYYYTAFGGSDCSASGTFCVGSYTGNGTSQTITSVGFQPDLVVVKRNAGSVGIWKSSSMSSTISSRFDNATNLASTGIEGLTSTGFSVGSSGAVNSSTGVTTYYYFAFKEVSGFMDVGSYAGNSADNRSISGVGFQPDFVWIKGDVAAFAQGNIYENYGDRSFNFGDSASTNNVIQALSSDGFQVGSSSLVNAPFDYYYVAFGGSDTRDAGTGDFDFINGTYTGTGSAFSITGLPFEPDLVIIKGDNTEYAVWRSRLMADTFSDYFTLSTFGVTDGITALTSDGFSVGTSATVNGSGVSYQWTAFGNAMVPDVSGGSDNFLLGAYIGTSVDDRNIHRLPISPNLVAVRGGAGTNAYWTTDLTVNSIPFANGTFSGNIIQSLDADGFQVGNADLSNINTGFYRYFAFDGVDCASSNSTSRFCVGTYTGGPSTTQDITTLGFSPDFLWVKVNGPEYAFMKNSAQPTDNSSYFSNFADITTAIINFIKNGFSAGETIDGNLSTYYYSAWNGKRYNQSAYRFFGNTDSTDVGSALAAQDTPAQLSTSGEEFRLRALFQLDYGNLFVDSQDFKLQYVDKGAGTCSAPSGGTPASYTDVTGATLIAFKDNTTPADGDALTSNANDPTDGGRTITNQSYVEANPFSNTESSILNTGQDGKWDFSLVDNGADPDTTFCFRMVFNDDEVLDTYDIYPEVTTAANASQTLSMSISDNTIGFGTLSSSAARYATSDTTGSNTDTGDAHTISVSTNASGGYVVIINGETLSCENCSNGATINAIGATPAASSIGTEQFGIRGVVNSGTGSVTSPYNTSDFALDTASFPDSFASGAGDAVTTEYGLRYLANISSTTDAGTYASTLTYTVTASF